MLISFLAHQGGAPGAHDLWFRWNADPVILLSLAAAIWAHHGGATRRRRSRDLWRARCFWAGLGAVAVALLSPLDAIAAELASAHMVQHVLLALVAAPLLAYSTPMTTLLTGAPRVVRRSAALAHRRLGAMSDALRSPAVAWLLHAGTLWFWHASVPYDAALEHPVVHAVEHACFLGTGVLFWSALVPRRGAPRASHGYGALLVFTMALQSVFLAALLTFATTPWYDGYSETAWGLDALADQQLAGAIMWVPAGLFYVAVGVLLVPAWVRDSGRGSSGGAVDDDWLGGAAPESVTRLSRLP